MRADNKRKLAAPITTDGSMYFDGKLWRQNKRADQISRLSAPEAYEIAAKAKAAAMSADEPSVEELNTDRRMEILTDDEIADIQRQLDCHQVVDNDLVQAALATIANLRSRLSHPTLNADRNAVIEECAKVCEDSVSFVGDTSMLDAIRDQVVQFVLADKIRALKQ